MNIMKFILENEIDRKQCIECTAIWFHFSHGENTGYYRLSPVAPESCPVCKPLDEDLEKNAVYTVARWMNE